VYNIATGTSEISVNTHYSFVKHVELEVTIGRRVHRRKTQLFPPSRNKVLPTLNIYYWTSPELLNSHLQSVMLVCITGFYCDTDPMHLGTSLSSNGVGRWGFHDFHP